MVGYCVDIDIDFKVVAIILISIVTMKKLIMYWWWGIALGLMDESVPPQEMEDYHPDTRVTISNLDNFLRKESHFVI